MRPGRRPCGLDDLLASLRNVALLVDVQNLECTPAKLSHRIIVQDCEEAKTVQQDTRCNSVVGSLGGGWSDAADLFTAVSRGPTKNTTSL